MRFTSNNYFTYCVLSYLNYVINRNNIEIINTIFFSIIPLLIAIKQLEDAII